MRKVGVRNASTFTGFCAKHDAEIFKSVDTGPFAGSHEECALLLYRATAWEYYAKLHAEVVADTASSFDKGKSLAHQIGLQSTTSAYKAGVQAAILDGRNRMDELERMMLARDFSDIRSLVIEFEQVPSIVAAAVFEPDFCLSGERIQQIGDLSKPLMPLGISLVTYGDKSYFVFSWTQGADAIVRKFVDEYASVDPARLATALTVLLFETTENIYANPQWWTQLSDETKAKLLERARSGAEPGKLTPATHLQFEGEEYGPWTFKRMYWVGC